MEEALDIIFEKGCLREQIDPRSFKEYVARAARVRVVTGMPLGFAGLRRYFRLRRHLSAGTLRSVKSAVLFLLRMGGKPMNEEEAARLDDVLDGLECAKGTPAKVRGAPTASQVHDLVEDTWKTAGAEEAAALVVGHGVAARANELPDLEASDVDLVAEVVWVNRKGRRLTKVRLGSQVERPITTPEALAILAALVKASPTGKLFKNLDVKRLSRRVADYAAKNNWDPDLWWSGIHNLRHGAAADTYRESIRAVRAVGSWQGPDAERRYGRLSRVGPKDRTKFRTMMAKKRND